MHLAAAPSVDFPGVASRSATPCVTLFTLFTAEARPVLAVDPRVGATVDRHIRALHGCEIKVLAWAVLTGSVELLLVGPTQAVSTTAVHGLQRRTGSQVRNLGHVRLWRRRVAALPIRPHHDLAAVLSHVLTAPERAGLADHWTDWPWCGSRQWPGIHRELLARHPGGLFWLDLVTSNRQGVA